MPVWPGPRGPVGYGARVAIALVVSLVVALALLVALVLVDRRRRRALGAGARATQRADAAERDRAAEQAEAGRAASSAARRTAELEATVEAQASDAARLRGLLEEAGARLERLGEREAELVARAQSKASQLEGLEAALAAEGSVSDQLRSELEAARASGEVGGGATAEAVWALLLARIERQWAAGVAAGPDERGWRGTDQPAQLTEALGRELDRLREEAGLYAELGGEASGAAPRAELLLAAGEVLATLAASADRLSVQVGEGVEVTAEGWTGDVGELAPLRAVVAGAGLDVSVEPGDGQVRVTLSASAPPG